MNIKQNETATTQEVQMKSYRVERALEMQISQCIFFIFLLQKMDLIDKSKNTYGV